MLFLKVTRSVKNFGARFGWLMAELVFVFLGMYGAFLLERMHDDDMDLLRKRQILQALVDEFEDYEKELGSASTSLDEAYGVPFFTAYSAGEKPFPTPIPYGGMGSVNTGIWEAMLQSGGIEVLEVEVIQQVQVFFKKLQDLLDLYSRFERLTEQMILPEMDQEVSFFYQAEGPELRDKYKWYVNSLFTIGMSLRSLSEQAATTKVVLLAEYEKVRKIEEKKEANRKNFTPRRKRTKTPKQTPLQVDQPEETVEEETSDELSDAHAEAIAYLIHQCQGLADFFETTKSGYDEAHAIPFFTSYSEGKKPLPFPVSSDLLSRINTKPLAGLLATKGVEEVLPADLLNSLGQLLNKISETEAMHQDFTKRCGAEISPDHNVSVFYDTETNELKENFQWFPNTLYSLGLALEDCQNESNSILAMLSPDRERNTDEHSAESVPSGPHNDDGFPQTSLDDNQTNSLEDEN
jgi:hypothetical protein